MTDERKFTCVALHKEKVIMATGISQAVFLFGMTLLNESDQ